MWRNPLKILVPGNLHGWLCGPARANGAGEDCCLGAQAHEKNNTDATGEWETAGRHPVRRGLGTLYRANRSGKEKDKTQPCQFWGTPSHLIPSSQCPHVLLFRQSNSKDWTSWEGRWSGGVSRRRAGQILNQH